MIEKHRRKKKPRAHPHYVWADPERFHVERMTAGLTQVQAAEYLGVSVRTMRNWETGCNRIPYPAFKLVRMRAGAIVHVERGGKAGGLPVTGLW
jgi:DNA-binding transcriptional regulator YiaG